MRARLCAVLAVAACGGSLGAGDDDAQPDGGNGSSDGAVEPGWTTLIERTWQLGMVEEDFKCVSKKIESDMYISAFRAKSPTGTHHEILSAASTPFMSGNYECDAHDNGMQMLYGGGIATQDLVLPPGVAIKLPAGTYINLNLHIANRSDDALSGTSGIEVQTIDASEVVHEADMMFLGTFGIHIPPTSQPFTEPAICSAPTTWNIVSLWPHMHGYATHQRVTVERNNGNVDTLLDTDYSYTEQKHYPMPSVLINPNDDLKVECIYVNDTNVKYPPGFEITYGDSATQEMCFAGFYKYPKGGTMYGCVEPGP
jgi:Copper type II ascorbate-dependent monooxygenase, C-terminal domain